jgi:hypothetical protein
MTHPRLFLLRLLLMATAGLGLAVAPVRADLLVNATASPTTVHSGSPTVTFQPHTDVAARQTTSDNLLDGFCHPIGMMMAVSFFPPGFPMNQPQPTPDGSVPGDPTITVSVPGLPQVPPPPPTDIGTPITQTTGTKTNPGGGSGGGVTGPVKQSPEPGTLISGLLGASLLGWVRWRRRLAA